MNRFFHVYTWIWLWLHGGYFCGIVYHAFTPLPFHHLAKHFVALIVNPFFLCNFVFPPFLLNFWFDGDNVFLTIIKFSHYNVWNYRAIFTKLWFLVEIQAIHDMSIYLDVSHMELRCKHANIMSLYDFLGNHIPNRER